MKKLFCYLLFILNITVYFSQNILIFRPYRNDYGKGYFLTYDAKIQKYTVKETFDCKFGGKGIRKEKEKDRKTPIGHYKIVLKEKKIDTPAASFGGYFMKLDYPNKFDINDNKTGSGIGIHGGRNSVTLGCVRILDADKTFHTQNIQTLYSLVDKGTDVIITTLLPPALVAKKGQTLTMEVSSFWANLITDRNSKEGLRKKFKAFANLPSNEKINIGKIKSSDGYANCRKSPEKIEDNIMDKIYTDEMFVYFVVPNSDWYYVVTNNGKEGYVNKMLIKVIQENTQSVAILDEIAYARKTQNAVPNEVSALLEEGEPFWYKEVEDNKYEIIFYNGVKGVVDKKT